MPDCLFCRVVEGKVPCERVAETERVLAFRDVRPQAPTHVLLIPKQHVADSAAELGPQHAEMLGELFVGQMAVFGHRLTVVFREFEGGRRRCCLQKSRSDKRFVVLG